MLVRYRTAPHPGQNNLTFETWWAMRDSNARPLAPETEICPFTLIYFMIDFIRVSMFSFLPLLSLLYLIYLLGLMFNLLEMACQNLQDIKQNILVFII